MRLRFGLEKRIVAPDAPFDCVAPARAPAPLGAASSAGSPGACWPARTQAARLTTPTTAITSRAALLRKLMPNPGPRFAGAWR